MEPFQKYLPQYRAAVQSGAVPAAYKGLMDYFNQLRLYLEKKYPDYFLSGSIHEGQMDFTYFYFFPKKLKRQKLKVVILFTHETFSFQVLLAGYNRAAQAQYLQQFKENGWSKHPLAASAKGVDFITQCILIANPDFSDLDALTAQIEKGTLSFIRDIESFLSK